MRTYCLYLQEGRINNHVDLNLETWTEFGLFMINFTAIAASVNFQRLSDSQIVMAYFIVIRAH